MADSSKLIDSIQPPIQGWNGPWMQNTIRLGEFEKQIIGIETKAGKVLKETHKDSKNIRSYGKEISSIHKDSEKKISLSNDSLKKKIQKKFQNELEEGEKIIEENSEKSKNLEKEISDLHQEILNYESKSNDRFWIYRRKLKEFEDLTHQYNILKEGYDDAAKENMTLKEDNDNKDIKIGALEIEVEDMQNVITRLTESRKILNKYFSSHYENFSDLEKRIIQEIEGNTPPGYYTNNPVPSESPIMIDKAEVNDNKMHINMNIVRDQSINANAKSKVNDRYENNNNVKSQQKQISTILNEEEFNEYRRRTKNGTNQQVPSALLPPLNQSSNNPNAFSKNFGPDDDYWYEQNK